MLHDEEIDVELDYQVSILTRTEVRVLLNGCIGNSVKGQVSILTRTEVRVLRTCAVRV